MYSTLYDTFMKQLKRTERKKMISDNCKKMPTDFSRNTIITNLDKRPKLNPIRKNNKTNEEMSVEKPKRC